MVPNKVCNKCHVELPFTEFHKQKKGKYGVSTTCKPCKIRMKKKNYRDNAPARIHYAMTAYIRKNFNLTRDEYDTYTASAVLCSICEKPFEDSKKCLDHNHSTNEIRGVLCSNCNTGLGLFQDCSDNLQKAIRYLDDRGNYSALRRGETESCAASTCH